MAHTLTPEQLEALRAMPLLGMPNKVEIALSLVGAKQADIVEDKDMDASSVHRVVKGKYSALELETSRKFAAFFGCQIEDLFPARVETPAGDGVQA